MRSVQVFLVLCILCGSYGAPVDQPKGLTLSVIHFNDFHARYDEMSPLSGVCRPSNEICHGGIARMATVIKELMSTRENPIVLNGGDSYQGTLYYNVFKWNITQHFMNLLPITAHTLGNHEFDDGVAGVIPYLKSLKAPVIVANLNDTFHPELQGLYRKSMVVNVEGKKIGLVGVMLSTTNEISNTEKLIFMDEIEYVNKEADRLVKEEGVFTVIVLSHCGYEVEQEIAKGATKHIGLIVGAHSHSLLYNGTPPDNSRVDGPYPTVVKRNVDGKQVLVVQAASYTRYLGDIVIHYDEEGEVDSYSGVPVFISSKVVPDPEIAEELKPYKDVIDSVGNEILGETKVLLNSDTCRHEECNFGDFVTDAMVFCTKQNAELENNMNVSLAFTNAGAIRNSISIGNITYNDLVTAQPFENTFDIGTFKGENIKAIFEKTAIGYNFRKYDASVNLLQVSGFKITYDLSRPEGERIATVQVKNPYTDQFEALEPAGEYRVIINSFLTNGGDGFQIIPDTIQNLTVGDLDIDCLRKYISDQSPIEIQPDGRIMFLNDLPVVKRK